VLLGDSGYNGRDRDMHDELLFTVSEANLVVEEITFHFLVAMIHRKQG